MDVVVLFKIRKKTVHTCIRIDRIHDSVFFREYIIVFVLSVSLR